MLTTGRATKYLPIKLGSLHLTKFVEFPNMPVAYRRRLGVDNAIDPPRLELPKEIKSLDPAPLKGTNSAFYPIAGEQAKWRPAEPVVALVCIPEVAEQEYNQLAETLFGVATRVPSPVDRQEVTIKSEVHDVEYEQKPIIEDEAATAAANENQEDSLHRDTHANALPNATPRSALDELADLAAAEIAFRSARQARAQAHRRFS